MEVATTFIPAAQPSPASKTRVGLQAPRLSVVIVNYHQWENTAALVKQLRTSQVMRQCQGEILIVDNHSPRHRISRMLRRCPNVSLLRWGRNRGFARAVNEGCRLSQGEWVLLLNPDMSLPDDFLDRLLAMTDLLTITEPRTGILGFGLRNRDGSPQLSAGFFPTLGSTLLGHLLPRAQRKYHAFPLDRRSEADWVTGCCLLIRRECLEELGGLDQDFFLYYEDVDLCRRARKLGWQVQYEPRLWATHFDPLHNRQTPTALKVVLRHSLLTYARKHWPRWQFRFLSGLAKAEALTKRCLNGLLRRGRAVSLLTELLHIISDLRQGNCRKARNRLRALTRKECFASRTPGHSVPENKRDERK